MSRNKSRRPDVQQTRGPLSSPPRSAFFQVDFAIDSEVEQCVSFAVSGHSLFLDAEELEEVLGVGPVAWRAPEDAWRRWQWRGEDVRPRMYLRADLAHLALFMHPQIRQEQGKFAGVFAVLAAVMETAWTAVHATREQTPEGQEMRRVRTELRKALQQCISSLGPN